jgi:hypothetical protein
MVRDRGCCGSIEHSVQKFVILVRHFRRNYAHGIVCKSDETLAMLLRLCSDVRPDDKKCRCQEDSVADIESE